MVKNISRHRHLQRKTSGQLRFLGSIHWLEGLQALDASWVAGVPPAPGELAAKTRYRQADAPCALSSVTQDTFIPHFPQAQWALTPGQSAVLHDGEVCLGGGVIAAGDQF